MAEGLIQYMKQLEATEPPEFVAPQVHYGANGSLTFYFHSDESYARRLNPYVMAFLSLDGDELVGCQVSGRGLDMLRGAVGGTDAPPPP